MKRLPDRKKICEGCRELWQEQKKLILLCFAATFLWGLLAHAYAFFNSNLNHDMLNAFIMTEAERDWKIALGRFVVTLLPFFHGAVLVPWLAGLVGILWTAGAVYMTVRLFDIKSGLVAVLISGIMVTNITYIAQIGTYFHEFDYNAFALMLAVAAAWLWRFGKCRLRLAGAALLLMLSMGIYQAYASVWLTIVICLSVMDLLRGKEIKAVIKAGLWAIAVLAAGGILYLLAGKLISAVSGVAQQERTDVMAQVSGAGSVRVYLGLIIPAMIDFARRILHPVYQQEILGLWLALCLLLAVLSVLLLFKKERFTPGRIALIVLLVLCLPFAMHCIYFLVKGEGFHDLMAYASWYVYVLLLAIFQWLREEKAELLPFTAAMRALCCALVMFVLWQNVITANTAYLKKENESAATLSTMTRVVSMLEQHEDYVFGETPVAFVGRAQVYGSIDEYEDISNIVGLEMNNALYLDHARPHFNVYRIYFDYVLNYPMVFCDDAEHEALKYSQQVQDMPSFPQKGCIELIDGVLVVKLGDIV